MEAGHAEGNGKCPRHEYNSGGVEGKNDLRQESHAAFLHMMKVWLQRFQVFERL